MTPFMPVRTCPAYGPIGPSTFAYDATVEQTNALDREQALQILADAGWTDSDGDGLLDKDGKRSNSTSTPVAITLIRPRLSQASSMRWEPIPRSRWCRGRSKRRLFMHGDPSMMVATFNNVDPRIMRLLFHSENVGENGWMWTHLHERDPDLQAQLDELLEKGDLTTNASERQQIYSEAQKLIVDNALALPMRVDFYIYGMSKAVQGWMTEPGGWPLAYNMWLSEQ